jgi:hypothetical protein
MVGLLEARLNDRVNATNSAVKILYQLSRPLSQKSDKALK